MNVSVNFIDTIKAVQFEEEVVVNVEKFQEQLMTFNGCLKIKVVENSHELIYDSITILSLEIFIQALKVCSRH